MLQAALQLGSTVSGGTRDTANGSYSVVSGGADNISNGSTSVVSGGRYNQANGDFSIVSGGSYNLAQGNASTVIGGWNDSALGAYSVAGGLNNTAYSYGEWVGGLFSAQYTPNSTTVWNANDRIFAIGNGQSTSLRSNAITILKNGNTGLSLSTPTKTLDVNGEARIRTINDTNNVSGILTANTNGVIQNLPIDSLASQLADSSEWVDGAKVGLTPGYIYARKALANGDTVSFSNTGDFFINNLSNGVLDSVSGVRYLNPTRSFTTGVKNINSGTGSFVGGGFKNNNGSAYGATVGGGLNYLSDGYTFIGGGFNDSAIAYLASVVGGQLNSAQGWASSIVGGERNTVASLGSFIGGGSDNYASGERSSIIGGLNDSAKGAFSVALGIGNTAYSYGEFVAGAYTENYTPVNTTLPIPSDRIFAIGNGTSNVARSNAMTILKNGNVGIGTTIPDVILDISGDASVGKYESYVTGYFPFVDNTYGNRLYFSGVAQNSDPVWIAKYNEGPDSTYLRFSVGDAANISDGFQFVQGSDVFMHIQANGRVGIGTTTPLAKFHIENGDFLARSNGFTTIASRSYGDLNSTTGSSFIGYRARGTIAAPTHPLLGDNLAAFGGRNGLTGGNIANVVFIAAENQSPTNLGTRMTFNTTPNGSTVPSTRMTIENDGNIGIGMATAPSERLQVNGNVAPTFHNTNDLGTTAIRWRDIYLVNAPTVTSDKRYKTNITALNYGLNEVLKLNTVSYNWKQNDNGTRLGFIAQELQDILPEVVSVGKDSAQTLGVRYTEIIPVLTKAIQEQQAIINELKAENKELKAEKASNESVEELKAENDKKELRLNKLESQLEQIQILLDKSQTSTK